MVADVVRTLPSPIAVRMPSLNDDCGTRGSHGWRPPAVWNGADRGGSTTGAPTVPIRTGTAAFVYSLTSGVTGAIRPVEAKPAGSSGVSRAKAGVDGP